MAATASMRWHRTPDRLLHGAAGSKAPGSAAGALPGPAVTNHTQYAEHMLTNAILPCRTRVLLLTEQCEVT